MELVYDYMHGDQVVRGNSGTLFDPYKYSGYSRLYIQCMHQLFLIYRKSFPLKKSHADAWQMTSLSFGFSIIECCQNSGGIGMRPREVKNSSAV